VFVTICPRAVLLHRSGRRARFSDFRVGQTVSVWSTLILHSDPAQTSADTVVIEPR
jgi:hypothetical protein